MDTLLYTAVKFLRLVQPQFNQLDYKDNEEGCFKMKNGSKMRSFQAFR
jgi:hypothetical protein